LSVIEVCPEVSEESSVNVETAAYSVTLEQTLYSKKVK